MLYSHVMRGAGGLCQLQTEENEHEVIPPHPLSGETEGVSWNKYIGTVQPDSLYQTNRLQLCVRAKVYALPK